MDDLRVEIKTVVLMDLVDSTALLDKLGDEPASVVFARCDRVARNLLTDWNGREIDRTDGFLLLFDRPIDACRYLMAYHAQLAELSSELGIDLSARAGVHLGEVVLRTHSTEDVARGAKPVEVDGLAKPTAARLAGLARGRQTLLTRNAFDLARRAAAGESTSDNPLQWLTHGRYRFKGVEDPLEVFEVGVAGIAPLTPPRDSEKARRVVAASRATWTAVAMVALIVVAVAAIAPKLIRREPAASASVAAPVPPVALSYWITVQKYRDGQPFEAPFRLAREINFETDYRIRLHFTAPRPGFLYLVSEAPDSAQDASPYNLLAAMRIEANQEKQIPEKSWFQFDDERGAEKVWIVWSGRSVPELEAGTKFINATDRGTIQDAGIGEGIRAFLKSHLSHPGLESDDATQVTRIRTESDPAAYLLRLEHH